MVNDEQRWLLEGSCWVGCLLTSRGQCMNTANKSAKSIVQHQSVAAIHHTVLSCSTPYFTRFLFPDLFPDTYDDGGAVRSDMSHFVTE